MTEGVRLLIAFGLAFAVAAAATPVAIAIARRIGLYDHPTGYKRHAVATPYLGGMAVALGLVAASLAVTPRVDGLEVIVVVTVGLLCIGTLDDRIGLGVASRLFAQLSAAAALYYAGLGFSGLGGEAANLLLTSAFVVAVVNAYNLMDNLDGAATTVALTSASVVGAYATSQGAVEVGVAACALAGACAGFLPFNLVKPRARVFLGDGGSMPIGFALAALMLALPQPGDLGWGAVPVMVVLVGLPALDTALVIVSRLRRGVVVLSGGRDHLTHRLEPMLGSGSSRRVAIVLAAAQTLCCALAIVLLQLQPAAAAVGGGVVIMLGMAAIVVLESLRWQPVVAAPVEAFSGPSGALQVPSAALEPASGVPAVAPRGESPV
jgi:UDP-GlcNAc:undecaprenyl-phosphate GlcNAc-1-phosphate transferase